MDYAGPLQVEYGMVRKPEMVKAYICVFVSLAVKAVHLEAASVLTSEAFIAALHQLITRRGCPSLIWSNHGTNSVGANRNLKTMYEFLLKLRTISDVCSNFGVEWRFIPECSLHFGGLWEAAVQ